MSFCVLTTFVSGNLEDSMSETMVSTDTEKELETVDNDDVAPALKENDDATESSSSSAFLANFEPIPLHADSEPISYTADASTYLADQKIPVLLEYLASNAIAKKPPDVPYFIRNLVADALVKLGPKADPSQFVSLLNETYINASDSRDNNNEIDSEGKPLRPAAREPEVLSKGEQQRLQAAERHKRMPPYVQHLKLTYFSHRGRADLAWMLVAMCKHANVVDVELVWMQYDDFEGAKDAFPFARLPVLDVRTVDEHDIEETFTVAESGAISRFLASIAGYLPVDDASIVAADSLVERFRDCLRSNELLTASSTEEQNSVFEDITNNRIPSVLNHVEGRLRRATPEILPTSSKHSETNDTGPDSETSSRPSTAAPPPPVFLCGSQVTWADLALYCEIDLLVRWGTKHAELFQARPNFAAWFKRVDELPQVRDFVAENWEGKEVRW